MVHALEKIHSLLKPEGFLLDIHPSSEPPSVEVRVGDKYYLAGWLKEEDEYIEYIRADEALQTVIEQGRYVVEKEGTFTFNTYAGSLDDLREYLKDVWEDAILDDQVAGRVEELWLSPMKDKELVIREIIRISRLHPL